MAGRVSVHRVSDGVLLEQADEYRLDRDFIRVPYSDVPELIEKLRHEFTEHLTCKRMKLVDDDEPR